MKTPAVSFARMATMGVAVEDGPSMNVRPSLSAFYYSEHSTTLI
jgi:hypothetical protein